MNKASCNATLGDIGELAAIERIGKRLPGHRDVVVGAGDDCAVVRAGDSTGIDLVFTSDPVIENTHFTSGSPPEGVGHKAVGRVLSDIAAMGAVPRWGLVDIVADAATKVSIIDGIYRGLLDLAARAEFTIVGGDLSEGSALEVHVFGVGEVPCGRAVLRSGARAGDLLFVTGSLGGSGLGRHMDIEPRFREGAWLRDWATAMIDISDGLASDLRHLTTMSHVGCDLESLRIPISEAAKQMPDTAPALDHALNDGEDFELLFTVPEERAGAFTGAWKEAFDLPCTRIGLMTGQDGLVRCVFPGGEARVLEDAGYAHFG